MLRSSGIWIVRRLGDFMRPLRGKMAYIRLAKRWGTATVASFAAFVVLLYSRVQLSHEHMQYSSAHPDFDWIAIFCDLALLATIISLAIYLAAVILNHFAPKEPSDTGREPADSTADAMGRAIAYILAVLFAFLGVADFWPNPRQGEVLLDPVTHYVFHVTLIIIGVLTCAAVRFRYGGGFWFISGVFLVGGAQVGIVSMVETAARGSPFTSTVLYSNRRILADRDHFFIFRSSASLQEKADLLDIMKWTRPP